MKSIRGGNIQKPITLHFKKLLFFPLLSLRVVWRWLYAGNIIADEKLTTYTS